MGKKKQNQKKTERIERTGAEAAKAEETAEAAKAAKAGSRAAVSSGTGLTDSEVGERMKAHADNRPVLSSTKTVADIVRSNVFTYFNLLFAVLAVLLSLAGAWSDMIFLPVIIANTCIGIVQEVHSKKVLDRLTDFHAPAVKVLRNGQLKELPSEELVLDDQILLEAGNRIPADAVVLEGELLVNEALLTGEADEIRKTAGDPLLSGSFAVSGKAFARLEKVGKDAYISRLVLEATKTRDKEQSEMIRSLNELIIVLGIIIIPIAIALFVQSYVYNGGSFRDSITGMVAAVIGMIPEGLYLLSSVALAVSTVRLAGKNVLIHDMKCIEALARADVLCVDKTGTITEPGMKLYDFQVLSPNEKDKVRQLLADFAAAMPKDNETMAAMQEYFGVETDGDPAEASSYSTESRNPAEVFPFSPETKYSAAVLNGAAYVLGAPERILREQYADHEKEIGQYGGKGFRVLLFAGYQGKLDGKALRDAVQPVALLLFSNPLRKGARETFSYFAECGTKIKVLSGDHPLTVSAVAKQAGIADADRYIDLSAIASEEELNRAAEEYTVFGRVTPRQKWMIVRALQAKKKTVAMTGDGVNDVLALKEADCSVAMASGSDAAANVSQLVLLDSDFSKMPAIVMEGRRVVNNIERTASLYIVKNIFSMLLAVFSVLLMWDYPLEPSQVSLISMFTIGIPSFLLALEPNRNRIRGHFLANVLMRALPAGLTDFIVVSGLVWFCREFQVGMECLSTSCTVLAAVVGFMILWKIARPVNRLHTVMIAVLASGFWFCMLKAGSFFGITEISRRCAMLTVLFAVAAEPLLRYFSMAAKKTELLQRDAK